MNLEKYEIQSPFLRRLLDEGRQRGIAESVARVLEARGMTVSHELREHLERRGDASALERILVLAVTVDEPDDLLRE